VTSAQVECVTKDEASVKKIVRRLPVAMNFWHSYDLLTANCEHFARWVCFGHWQSYQVTWKTIFMDFLPCLPERTLPLACVVAGLAAGILALSKLLLQDPAEEEGRAWKKRRTLY